MIKKTNNAANVQTVMNSIFIKFANLAAEYLTDQLRTPVTVEFKTDKQMVYKKYLRSRDIPTTTSAIINMEPLQCNAALEIDYFIAFSIVDCLCGGTAERRWEKYPPGEIEASLLEGIIVRLLAKMREAWAGITDLKPSLRQIEPIPMFAHIANPKDKVIIVNMETAVDSVKGKMNFCIPYCAVETLLDRLSGKYIDTANLDLFANLTAEVRNLKKDFTELKKDISSDISRLFKENKYDYSIPDLDPGYDAHFRKIAKEKVEDIVELIRFYLMGDAYKKAAVFLAALGTEPSVEIFKTSS